MGTRRGIQLCSLLALQLQWQLVAVNVWFMGAMMACHVASAAAPVANEAFPPGAVSAVKVGSSASASSSSCEGRATLFVFGDSKSDTGNGVLSGNIFFSRTTRPPYGRTFPGYPARRFCDGRLRLDYLTAYLGLPPLNPSLDPNANISWGVNYAVSGATALNTSELNEFGIVPLTSLSLETQLGWHLHLKANVDSSDAGAALPGKPLPGAFKTGLYLIEIGGNDYVTAFQKFQPSEIISSLLPKVIQKIRMVTETLYDNGARNFVLYGVPAFGCTSSVLAEQGRNSGAKDANGCLTDYNVVASTHNDKLHAEVQSLRAAFPDATFIFVDFYAAFIDVLNNKASLGFVNSLDACCGAGNVFPYNYNLLLFCSQNSLSLCANPSDHINWDGIHYTQAFNAHIFQETFVRGSYVDPSNGLAAYCARSSD